MNERRLFLLMSLSSPDDLKWYESWDDDWEWLYDKGLINFTDQDDEKPFITDNGQMTVQYAVKKSEGVI